MKLFKKEYVIEYRIIRENSGEQKFLIDSLQEIPLGSMISENDKNRLSMNIKNLDYTTFKQAKLDIERYKINIVDY